jgi:hypothetical protein
MITWQKVSVQNNKYAANVGDVLHAELLYPVKRNGVDFATLTVSNSAGSILLHTTIPDFHKEDTAKKQASGLVRALVLDMIMEIDNGE